MQHVQNRSVENWLLNPTPDFPDDLLENILNYIFDPHKPNNSALSFMKVSKKWMQMTQKCHPILQVIGKLQEKKSLIFDDTRDYSYPQHWAWNLDDTLSLVQSGFNAQFCHKLKDENMELTLNKLKEEKSPKKRKLVYETNLAFILPLYNPCKYKTALDRYITLSVQSQELTYKIISKAEQSILSDAYKLFSKNLISKKHYDSACKQIKLENDGLNLNCNHNNYFRYLSQIWYALESTNHNAFSKTCSDKIINYFESLCKDLILQVNELELEQKDCMEMMKDSILLHKLFYSLTPKQKFQLIATVERHSQFLNLYIKTGFLARIEAEELLKSLKINPFSNEPYPFEGCRHLRNNDQLAALYDDFLDGWLTGGQVGIDKLPEILYCLDANFLVPEVFFQPEYSFISGKFYYWDRETLQNIFKIDGLAENISDEFLKTIESFERNSGQFIGNEDFKNIKDYIKGIRQMRDDILKESVKE